jgi:hypothetical protein
VEKGIPSTCRNMFLGALAVISLDKGKVERGDSWIGNFSNAPIWALFGSTLSPPLLAPDFGY